MTNIGYALARADLIRTLTAYNGITTADGAADGTTFIDRNLINSPIISAAAIPEKTILIMSGNAKGGDKGSTSFDNITGTVALQGTGFAAQIKAGTIYKILNISSVEIDVATINTNIGTATDDGDAATLFAKAKKIILGVHTHILLVVADASAPDADKDTALKDLLEAQGYEVVVADPTDIAGNLELAFDFIVVSGSITVDNNLGNLRDAGCPVICHSAAVAVSNNVFSLGANAGTEADQTDIEIITNTLIWLITTGTGDLAVTASATISHMQTKAANALKIAETSVGSGNTYHTMVRLLQNVEDDSGYAANFDRYFIGVIDFTLANAVFKALMVVLWEHVLHEVRFSELVVTPKRVYQEQIPDTDVSDTATTTETECILLEKGPKNNRRFCLRDFRLKVQADPSPDTMTVRLYEYFEGSLTEVDSFDIDTTLWGTYHSLMDMFGVPEVHSDAIKITCQMDANSYAVKATYSYAEARK